MTSANHITQTPVIQMTNVRVGALRDASTIMLDQVNWTVNPGDYWVLAGVQGAGKSDFLSMTAGLTPPLTGSYNLYGRPMPLYEEEDLGTRLRLGMVFDGGNLLHRLTVAGNVALPLRYRENLTLESAEHRVRELLDALELSPFADSSPGALGRNWTQRAGLARALILKPEVLLVDSPLSGLDLRHSNWWLRFLDALSRGHPLVGGRPMTLIVTVADLRPWIHRARQFAVLRDGRFVALGNRAQLDAASLELTGEVLPAERGGD